MDSEAGCCFCAEFARGHMDYGGRRMDRTVLSTPSFRAFPAVGQIVEGYLLVVSQEHRISMAALERREYGELEDVLARAKKAIEREYGPSLVFEHGSVSEEKRGGGCIQHAHFHVVPMEADIVPELDALYLSRRVRGLEELAVQYERQQPYLFVERQDGERRVFLPDQKPPGQYLRRVAARHVPGMEDMWDWAAFPGYEAMGRTVERLRPLLACAPSYPTNPR
jgi:ATP adenylyltransferase